MLARRASRSAGDTPVPCWVGCPATSSIDGVVAIAVSSILVAYDGSDHSDRALRRAEEYARALGAPLVVMTVEFPVMPVAGPPDVVAPVAIDDAVEKAKQRAETAIGRARSIVEGAEFVTRLGDAVDVILGIADERDVDLIVVGTEEPGFFERLLRGSLSQAVARRAPCDVLVVR
jgi:nucleotide-binding universal stress UspA family protein